MHRPGLQMPADMPIDLVLNYADNSSPRKNLLNMIAKLWPFSINKYNIYLHYLLPFIIFRLKLQIHISGATKEGIKL